MNDKHGRGFNFDERGHSSMNWKKSQVFLLIIPTSLDIGAPFLQ